MEPEQLGIVDPSRREAAILYLPSPTRVTSWMLDNIGVDPQGVTFVDLGCGKGRVLLIAAERPFRRIIGVEISAELATIARANLDRYRPTSERVRAIEIANDDVTTFELPPSDLLIHLYHPFQPEITAAVLRRLETSLEAVPRRVLLAYLAYTAAIEPVAEMLSEFRWLHRTRYEQSVRGHYNWLLYSN